MNVINRFALLALLTLAALPGFTQTFELSSPDGNLTSTITPGNSIGEAVRWSLNYSGTTLLENGSVGIEPGKEVPGAIRFKKSSRKTVNGTWQPVYGERNLIPENYRQLTLHFTSASANMAEIIITLRAYNEGFA